MHLITIAMHAVAPGELNGLPDAETNVLLFFSDGTSCEGYYDGDHPDQPGVPFFRDAEGDALDGDVIGWADMPSGRNGGAPEVHRAFAIADHAMFELLISEGVPGDSPAPDTTVFGLVAEDGQEVTTLAAASPELRDAIEWLRDRGYVELGTDGGGEFVQVIRRPGEDS